MKSLALFVIGLFAGMSTFAHALWIETNPLGQKGKLHEIKVFYGEYAEGKPEKLEDWFSDMKEFTLWLVSADNQRIQLPVAAAEDHFTASFIPETEGQYCLQISHYAKDLGRTTKYQFNTSAIVTVGKAVTNDLAANHNPLKFSVKGGKLKQPVVLNGFFNDAATGGMDFTIFSPGGWTKTVAGDATGSVQFVPEWKGKYMIEISRTDNEKGEHNGKQYERVWRCATYFLEVK